LFDLPVITVRPRRWGCQILAIFKA
jgi:hypothetical protein